jgi:HSP20 family protein
MSLLSKWSPLGKADPTDPWRPITRWDPIREMEDMMRGMQRIMSVGPFRSGESLALAQWSPTVDIGESEKEFVVKAELPEVSKEDIKVSVENNTLSICGERKTEKEEKDLKFHRVERSYGRFERCFTLPDEADSDKITSEYKDGVLTVHLPKNPSLKPAAHQIPVR